MKTPCAAFLTLSLLAAPAAQAQTTSPSTPAPATTAQTVTIASVELRGFTVFDPAQIRAALAERLGIKPGASVSVQTLETGRQLLAQSYPQQHSLFTPEVKLSQAAGQNGTVVTYTVDESAALNRVEISGVRLVGQDVVRQAFGPLQQARRLTPSGYQAALTQLAQAYSRRGIVFDAPGVQASLTAGVLKVTVNEPFVQAVETGTIKTSAAPTLQTRAGQPLQPALLNADARALSNASGRAVSWQAAPVSGSLGQMRVTFFHADDAASDRVSRIVVQGNTSVPTADILKVLRTQVGDVASAQLAQQDYFAIQNLYDERGLALSATEDSLDFQGGVLTFSLHEARIGAYQFSWEGGQPLIDEKVLARQLPAAGRAFNRAELQRALSSVDGYDNFTLVSRDARALDPQHPENLTVVLNFAPRKQGIPVGLAAAYDSQNGLGGEFTYTSNNVLRSGNAFRATLGANANDVGQRLNGSVNYTIPWIDTNFLNLGGKRTSLSVGAWSQASGNNTLSVKGSDGLPTGTDTGRQYTTRNTGASLQLNREITPQLTGSFGVQVSKTSVYLEPYKSGDSNVTDTTYQNDAQAGAQLPLGNTTALTILGLQYDTTDSGVYPSQGVRTGGSVGYGFGVQGGSAASAQSQSRLSWGQLESGASTYLGFGRSMSDGSKQTVLAARVNAGTLLGTPGESNVYRVGASMNPAYELRGQTTTQAGTSYLTASTELRHNFGVKLGNVVQGVYGLAFVDTGDAWRQGSAANPFNLNTSYGLGTQLNTSFANVQLSYGFTTVGSNKFSLRLGNFW
ncbi:POTRA domain-containing protein [Deinococcus fonticola]|uniref:POTRA domain-containing protein n=1 Tax=Deinococcus fonticola TaxID=2528713 RepID=UPI001074D5B7|nr:POTRA domain-containing protein [Deinococcus fonticola]